MLSRYDYEWSEDEFSVGSDQESINPRKEYQLLLIECNVESNSKKIIIRSNSGYRKRDIDELYLQENFCYQNLKIVFRSETSLLDLDKHSQESVIFNYLVNFQSKTVSNLKIYIYNWILVRDFSILKKKCLLNCQTIFDLIWVENSYTTEQPLKISLESTNLNFIRRAIREIYNHVQKRVELDKMRVQLFNLEKRTLDPLTIFERFEAFKFKTDVRRHPLDLSICTQLFKFRNLSHILYRHHEFLDFNLKYRVNTFEVGHYHPSLKVRNSTPPNERKSICLSRVYSFRGHFSVDRYFTSKPGFTSCLLLPGSIIPSSYLNNYSHVLTEYLLSALVTCLDNGIYPGLGEYVNNYSNKNESFENLEDNLKSNLKAALPSLCEETPNEFLCPITCEIMKDPVIATDGHTYERDAITQWFKGGHRRSPKTNQVISNCLFPNYNLKSLISDYRGKKTVTDKFRKGPTSKVDLVNLVLRKYPYPFLWINKDTGYLAIYNELTQEMIFDFQVPLLENQYIKEVGLLVNNHILIEINSNELLDLDLTNLTLKNYFF